MRIHSFGVLLTALLIPLIHYPEFGSMFVPQSIFPTEPQCEANDLDAIEVQVAPQVARVVKKEADGSPKCLSCLGW